MRPKYNSAEQTAEPLAPRMTVRLGIIGSGNISETHVRAAREVPGAEVVAYWGRNVERVARLAAAHGGTAHRELDEFLGQPMDAVIVGTPSGLHADHARAAARR